MKPSIILISCIISLIAPVNSYCTPGTLSALTAFYRSLGGASWSTKTHWMDNNYDPCSNDAGEHCIYILCVLVAGLCSSYLSLCPSRNLLHNFIKLIFSTFFFKSFSVWYGVYIDQASYYTISQLRLYTNNLVGTLPTELGLLSRSTKFRVQSNHISGRRLMYYLIHRPSKSATPSHLISCFAANVFLRFCSYSICIASSRIICFLYVM
jgi:hypothetical protein